MFASSQKCSRPGQIHVSQIKINGVIWFVLGAIGLFDWLFASNRKLLFYGWERPLLIVGLLSMISGFYKFSGRSNELAAFAYFCLLWVLFSALGGMMTYIVNTWDYALSDELFATFDRAFGFDWMALASTLPSHPLLFKFLQLVYVTLMPQLFLTVFMLSIRGHFIRNGEVLLAAMLSLAVAALVSGRFPSMSACVYFQRPGLVPEYILSSEYLRHLIMLRSGKGLSSDIQSLQGIVTMPSYHAVLGVIVTYAHRGAPIAFFAFAALNIFMLLSIPFVGCHFLVDVLAGTALGVVAITIARFLVGRGSDGSGELEASVLSGGPPVVDRVR